VGQAAPRCASRPPLRLPVRANPFPSNKKRGRPINKGPKQHSKRCNSAVSSCRTDVFECDISAHAFSTLQHIDPGLIISRHLDRNDVRRPSRTFTFTLPVSVELFSGLSNNLSYRQGRSSVRIRFESFLSVCRSWRPHHHRSDCHPTVDLNRHELSASRESAARNTWQ